MPGGEILPQTVVEWVVLIGIVVHVLAEVIGQIKGSEIVVRELKVDEQELLILFEFGASSKKDVAPLDIIMTKHNGRVKLGEKFPANITFRLQYSSL